MSRDDDYDLPPEGGYPRRRKPDKPELPPPTTPEDQLLYATLFVVALGFLMALAMQAWGLFVDGLHWVTSGLWAWITQ